MTDRLRLPTPSARRKPDPKPGNIIFDLVFRSARELTSSDVGILYDLDEGGEQLAEILNSTREKDLQILELNASYGAHGLFPGLRLTTLWAFDPGLRDRRGGELSNSRARSLSRSDFPAEPFGN
jgi:hypothetical protein